MNYFMLLVIASLVSIPALAQEKVLAGTQASAFTLPVVESPAYQFAQILRGAGYAGSSNGRGAAWAYAASVNPRLWPSQPPAQPANVLLIVDSGWQVSTANPFNAHWYLGITTDAGVRWYIGAPEGLIGAEVAMCDLNLVAYERWVQTHSGEIWGMFLGGCSGLY